MNLECFICTSPTSTKVVRLTEDPDALNFGHGICHKCSILVCTAHGQRVASPPQDEYLCVLCVPSYIRKGGFPPRDPGDPDSPQSEMEQVLKAISFAPEPVVDAVQRVLVEYMQRRKLKETAPIGEEGRNLAAEAFSKAMNITQFLREVNRRLEFEK